MKLGPDGYLASLLSDNRDYQYNYCIFYDCLFFLAFLRGILIYKIVGLMIEFHAHNIPTHHPSPERRLPSTIIPVSLFDYSPSFSKHSSVTISQVLLPLAICYFSIMFLYIPHMKLFCVCPLAF